MDWPLATCNEASTILEAFETSLETLGRGWSHHRFGRGHWNQWGVLLGWPFGQVVWYFFFNYLFLCLFFGALGNMGHFYVDLFVSEKIEHALRRMGVFGWLMSVDGRSWRWRVMTCVEGLSEGGCWDIGIGRWEGLTLFLKPLLGSVK